MKTKVYYSLAVILAIFVISSCTDALNVEPEANEIIQPDFQDISDIEAALSGVYSALKSDRMYTQNLVALGEWTADNLGIAAENVGFGAIIHEWDYTESDATVEGVWIGIYDLVRRANFVIRAGREYEGESIERAKRAMAEALVLKSFALLEAHRLFGQTYGDGTNLSVVYVEDPDDILQQKPRESASSLFALLRSDLDEAIMHLDEAMDVNFVSKAFVHGLLARLASYEKNWQEVVIQCDLALQSADLNISSITDYPLMWGENDQDGESIFRLALDSDDAQLGDLYFNDGVGPVFDPVSDITELYTPGDVRINSFFLNDAEFGLIISKFLGPASNRGLFETIIMRVSELVLLKAEAHAERGEGTLALDQLDQIRTNRIPGFQSPGETGDALVQAIHQERRKELVYEGYRFSDLKRWGEKLERQDCRSDECVLEAGDFKFTFAIPRAELFANENMIQNPGY